jgi:hypothetical protein
MSSQPLSTRTLYSALCAAAGSAAASSAAPSRTAQAGAVSLFIVRLLEVVDAAIFARGAVAGLEVGQ